MPGADFAGEYGAVKSKEAILEDNAAMAAILRNMRVFTLLLAVAVVLIYVHLAQILYARFVKFPATA
ncbi:hypothetical protein LJD47_29065, partial [Escherichia coli]|nr:hypothetical protein [Escherichia coli]